MKKIFYIYLFIIPLILASCVGEVDDVFDNSASHRMEAALEEYRTLLTGSENGWFADYYPEKSYAVGGYAMYFKFDKDGTAGICTEKETNLPMYQVATSEWDLIAEQGPVLAFMTYNPVLHYFSEPIPNDINGQQADYEFVVVNAGKDSIELKGKRFNNKLILRRNTENLDPTTYFQNVVKTADDLSSYGMFSLNINNERIGTCSVVDRTFSVRTTDENGEQKDTKISYTFTSDGIRLAIPYEFKGIKIQNFVWNEKEEKYTCTDSGINAFFHVYFPDDYQLKYDEFIGTWKFKYHGSASATAWIEKTIEIVAKKKNVSFLMTSPELFSFQGITLSFDAQKGIISILVHNTDVDNATGYDIRACAHARPAGYINPNIGPVGLIGNWNEDAGGARSIEFVDNKKWVTYKATGILLRFYDGTTSKDNFTTNIAGHMFTDITITKISN